MKKTLKALGKAACYAFYFLVMQNIVALAVMAGDFVQFVQRYESLWNSNPLGLLELFMARMELEQSGLSLTVILWSNVAAVAGLWLFFRLRRRRLCREIRLVRPDRRTAVYTALIGLTAPAVIALATELIPFTPEQLAALEANSAYLETGETPVLLALVSVLAAPVAEEVVYRGLVYSRLRRALPVWLSMILSAAVFASGHPGIVWFVSAFLAGLLLAWVYERTGSLAAPILVHMLNNASLGYPGWLAIACVPVFVWALVRVSGPGKFPRTAPSARP